VPGDVVSVGELDAPSLAAWSRLAGRAAEPNPFYEPEFVLPACRHLPTWEGTRVARVFEDDELLALLPVQPRRSWRRLKRPVLFNRPPLVGLGTPLVDRDHVEDGTARLLETLLAGARRGLPGLAVLEWLGDDGPVARALDAAAKERRLPLHRYDTWQRVTLRRRPEPTYLEEAQGPVHRRELRRRFRRLADAMGGEPTLVDRTADPGGIEEFLRLEAKGWKGAAGRAMAVAADGTEAFFREVCANFGAQGRFRLLSLERGGLPAAMACYLVSGSTLFVRWIAFDADFDRYSPGAQLDAAMFQYFHAADGLDSVDSCNRAHDHSMDHLWPDRRTLSTVLIGLSRLDRAVVRLVPPLRWTAGAVKARNDRRAATRVGPVAAS
jgi:CelD/BcsL family acetyltransferase involved in cellulose biosynthesis